MRTRTLVLAASAALGLAPLSAHAGGDAAWLAAKSNLPAETTVLLGLDVAQLTKSSLFSLAVPMMMSQQPDIKNAMDTIKDKCSLDPFKVIKKIVIGTDEAQTHGAIFIAVDGLDPTSLTACVDAIAKTKGKSASASDGKVSTIAIGDKSVYYSWIGTNVIVLPFDMSNKADLEKWNSGKGIAKSKVATGAGKVNTGSAVWAVSAVEKELDAGTKMKMGYGAISMASSKLGAELHVKLANAKSATDAATKANAELVKAAAEPGLADNLKSVLTSTKVTTSGDELVVKSSIPEADVLSLVMELAKR